MRHQGPGRQYVRDVVLAVNDGLVSIFLLVAGVVGGGFDANDVFLAGLAGAVAGAISMASGEYLATKSQEEVLTGEAELEKVHLRQFRDYEMRELAEMLRDMGLEDPQVERVAGAFASNDDALLRLKMAIEFGVVERARRSPVTAMIVSGLVFVVGSVPAVLPFAVMSEPGPALLAAAVATSVALFAVGAAKTRATRGSPLRSGLENLAIALIGAAVSFGVGRAYDQLS